METIDLAAAGAMEAAERAASVLSAGGVIIFPAETLYGLGARARDPDAVRRVFELKGRGRDVPLPVMAADLEMAGRWAVFTDQARELAGYFWPGPLTLVLEARDFVDQALTGGTGKLGIRVPGAEFARLTAAALECPLTATSANKSGRPAPRAAMEALDSLAGEVDLVVDGGTLPGGLASTVAEIVDGRLKILRRGVLAEEELEAAHRRIGSR